MAGEDPGSLPFVEIQENGMPLFVQDKELRSGRAEGEGAYRTAVFRKELRAFALPAMDHRYRPVGMPARDRRPAGGMCEAGDRRRVSREAEESLTVADAGQVQAARFIAEKDRTIVGREGECGCTPAAFP
jgi:hypothetical protein